jgi:hypothetical protein
MRHFFGCPEVVRGAVRKPSGTTNRAICECLRKSVLVARLGCQGSTRFASSTPGPSGFRRMGGCSLRSIPTTGGRLPATIQDNQRGQGYAPAPQARRVAVIACRGGIDLGHFAFACSLLAAL